MDPNPVPCAALVAGALITMAASAAGTEPHPHSPSEEVVVTADPLGSTTAHIVQPVQVLAGDDLERRSTRSIGETVSRVPGVTSQDFGPGVGRPLIRGLGGARVRVLEDGLGSMDVSALSPDHAVATEAIFARQVEIFRGPATLLYGSGASGGLVNSVTRRLLDYVPDGVEGGLYGHYDSVADGWQGAFDLSAGAGAFAMHLDGIKRDTGDYDIPGFGALRPDAGARSGTLENSDSDTEGLTGGLSWVGSRAFVAVSAGTLDNEYGVPGGHAHEHEGAGEEADDEDGGVRIEQEQIRFDLAAGLDAPLPGIASIRTRWGRNDHEHAEVEASGEIGTLLVNEEWEGRVEVRHLPLHGWDGALGVQYRDRDFTSSGEEAFVPPSTLESVGVFVLEKRDWRAWHFELGARFEHQDTGTATGLNARHDVYSVSGGVHRDLDPRHKLSLALTRAQRAPSIEELYSDGPHAATNTFEIGDPSLGEETSSNVDVALERRARRWSWRIGAFYNRIDDFIFLQSTDLNTDGVADRVEEDFSGDPAEVLAAGDDDEPLLVRYAAADAELYGFEADSTVNLFDDTRGHLDLRLWADYVRGRLVDGGDLPRIPPLRFGVDLDWWRGPFAVGLEYVRTTRQDDPAALETPTRGYDMLDLHAAYRLASGPLQWTLFVRASNLFDEEARRHVSFLKEQAPLPGRSALIGVRARF